MINCGAHTPTLQLIPLKSRRIEPRDDIKASIDAALKKARAQLRDGDVLVITSKVVAVCEDRIVTVKHKRDEDAVARREADVWLGGKPYPFSVKDGILIPRSGIDASNAAPGTLILWPRDSWKTSADVRAYFAKKCGLKNFGVIITDSTCRPLRWGVTGIALGWAGFAGVADRRGEKDLFGTPLRVTQTAAADAIAAGAGLVMGDAAEAVPFVIARDAPVRFTARTVRPAQFQPRDDLFAPIYTKAFRERDIR